MLCIEALQSPEMNSNSSGTTFVKFHQDEREVITKITEEILCNEALQSLEIDSTYSGPILVSSR